MDSQNDGTENLGALHGSSLKSPGELTESERFAISHLAGVGIDRIEWSLNSFKIILKPAAISIVEGKYVVHSRAR